jgi:hypothetical protein
MSGSELMNERALCLLGIASGDVDSSSAKGLDFRLDMFRGLRLVNFAETGVFDSTFCNTGQNDTRFDARRFAFEDSLIPG